MDKMIEIYEENQRLQKEYLNEFNNFLNEKQITEEEFYHIVNGIIFEGYEEMINSIGSIEYTFNKKK